LSFGAVAILFYAGNSRLGPNEPRRWRGVLIQWGAAQWAVTVGGLPLLLLFFQQFSLVSPLANLVAVPVVSFVVTPLALIFAVIPWPPLLHLDHWVMVQLMALLDWLAAWPVWQQAAPPLWAVLLALVGVVWLLLPRGFPARWLGLCLLLPALFPPLPRPGMGEAWADVLDVGQGLAVVVRTARHALLYDTGPGYGGEADAGQRVVVPFLRTNGVAKLDALVVSHRDQDHSGGLVSVRAHAPVGRILASFAEAGGERCAAGQSWEWDGVRFTMLHPESDDYEKKTRTNAMSCVLRVESVGASLLLPADIEAANERALVARAAEALRADVLVVPHHGGKGSSTLAFVSAVAPEHAVFSAGYRNPFGHPRPEILARYGDSSIWRTDRDGAVRVVLGEGAEVTVWRAERRRYWQHR
jgi:competence protein ComEC